MGQMVRRHGHLDADHLAQWARCANPWFMNDVTDELRRDTDMERPVKYLTRQHKHTLRLRRFQAQVDSGRGSACRRLITLIFVDRAQGPPSWS